MHHAHFEVDPRLAALLGESYHSSEDAIKELVDNSWDADADAVHIQLPNPMTSDPVVISDTGTGMTPPEVQQEYLRVARDRRLTRGNQTVGGRRVKGRRGIGKFAGLMVAGRMVVETCARSQRTTLTIRKEDLANEGVRDLGKIELPLEVSGCGTEDRGTTISLYELHQSLAFPTPDKLRSLLVMEYGREAGFTVFVNGEALGVRDVKGESFQHEEFIAEAGGVKLTFKLMDERQPERRAGIALRVDGKIVGKPGFFGLETDENIPKQLLRRVYGEIEADGLIEHCTANWGAIVENSKPFAAVQEIIRKHLRSAIQSTFTKEMNLQKARLQKIINDRLAAMPENRRQFAQRMIQRLLKRFYGEPEDRVEPIVSVLLEALEHDDYRSVLEKMHEAGRIGVSALSEALEEFGLLELSLVGQQCRRRQQFLDWLEELISSTESTEADAHRALANNLWVFGSEYSLIASNRTLRTIVKAYLDKKFTEGRATTRPDLLLTAELDRRHVLIEFKHPRHRIERDNVMQAEQYRDDLAGQIQPIDLVLVGKDHNPRIDLNPAPRVRIFSYLGLISRARAELQWLLQELAKPGATGVGQ